MLILICNVDSRHWLKMLQKITLHLIYYYIKSLCTNFWLKLPCFVAGCGRKGRILRQWPRRLCGRGLFLRHACLQRGLLLQLHRGRDVGKVPIHSVWLCPAAKTLASGYSPRGTLQSHSHTQEATAGMFLLLVGDDATVSLQHLSGRSLSDTVSSPHRLPMRIHCRCEHLYVCVRCHQIVHDIQIRCLQVHFVFNWRDVRDAV